MRPVDDRERAFGRNPRGKTLGRRLERRAPAENAAILLRDRSPGQPAGETLQPGPIPAREHQGPEIGVGGWHALFDAASWLPFRIRARRGMRSHVLEHSDRRHAGTRPDGGTADRLSRLRGGPRLQRRVLRQPGVPQGPRRVLVRPRGGRPRHVPDRTGRGARGRAEGRPHVVTFHLAWFALWVLINSGLVAAFTVFDAYPYGLLGIVLTIEGILITLFLLVSSNRQTAHAEKRAALDYEVNVRTWRLVNHLADRLDDVATRLQRLEKS